MWRFWKRTPSRTRAAIAMGAEHLAHVEFDPATREILRWGLEPLAGMDAVGRLERLRALHLPADGLLVQLPLTQYQLLQIDRPAVPADELKAAARWRIKDLVDTHIDNITLDVMSVGDASRHTQQHLFVVAAANTAVAEAARLTHQAGLNLAVIDIQETAQRHLQTAAARALGVGERATAALVVQGRHCLLTICAGEELYLTRRLDWDAQLIAQVESTPVPEAVELTDSTDPVDLSYEYSLRSNPYDQVGDTPRLVVDLQRSLDVWERSWPDLPLALLMIDVPDHRADLCIYRERELGLRVVPLDERAALTGDVLAGATAEERCHCLPLLGAVLRTEPVLP